MTRARREILRTSLAAAMVAAAGYALAHVATDGFEAYTMESARRLSALRSPAPMPQRDLVVVDRGRAGLAELPAPLLLVDFVYTRCPTYCAVAGSVYAQLQRRLAGEIAAGRVALLSISFDPRRDDDDALRAYRARYSAQAGGWDLARPRSAAELSIWLEAFGVVVIPDELGGYTHNAAIHVVGPDRRLIAIHDLADLDGVVRTVRARAEGAPRAALD